MGLLAGKLGRLLLYFAAATLLAQLVIGTTWLASGRLNREKLLEMLAVIQGINLWEIKEDNQPVQRDVTSEQVSLERIAAQRALASRDMELREQALRGQFDQIQSQRRKLVTEREHQDRLEKAFAQRLEEEKQRTDNQGLEEAVETIVRMQPKQAKEVLRLRLDTKSEEELDQVVAILSAMPPAGRAKILKEFKTPDEIKQLDEILRKIEEGGPAAGTIESTPLDQAAQTP